MELSVALCNEIKKHLGETVTVYTTSGGSSGSGYTGVLIQINCFFIKIIKHTGPRPCNSPKYGSKRCYMCKRFGVKYTVTTSIIPIDKIAAFVFNAI